MEQNTGIRPFTVLKDTIGETFRERLRAHIYAIYPDELDSNLRYSIPDPMLQSLQNYGSDLAKQRLLVRTASLPSINIHFVNRNSEQSRWYAPISDCGILVCLDSIGYRSGALVCREDAQLRVYAEAGDGIALNSTSFYAFSENDTERSRVAVGLWWSL